MAARLKLISKITAVSVGSLGSLYLYRRTKVERPKLDDQIIDKPVTPKQYELPHHIDYLLIGGGTASHSAMRAIRSNDPLAKVLIISQENQSPYMRPPLSKELWFTEKSLRRDLRFKWWNAKEKSVFFEIDEFYIPVSQLIDRETGGVSVVKNATVTSLSPEEKLARLDNGQEIRYNKCLLATGGVPKQLPSLEHVPDELKDRIIYFRTINDFLKLDSIREDAEKIVIIGGGLLGSELACALGRNQSKETNDIFNTEIIQIYPEAGNLAKILPKHLSDFITTKVKSDGTKVIPNVELKSVKAAKDKTCLLTLSDGQTIKADYIICAVGIEPDVNLAKASGLEVDEKTGGFLVNSELESRTDIWVAGDASCYYDIKLGRRRVEHHDHAVNSGGLAGQNMVGKAKPYLHQPMFWSDLGSEISLEAVGNVDSSLESVSVFPSAPEDEYSRGLVFYLKDKIIVGIILWNLFGRIHIARRILDAQEKYDDLNEVAKLFNIYLDE